MPRHIAENINGNEKWYRWHHLFNYKTSLPTIIRKTFTKITCRPNGHKLESNLRKIVLTTKKTPWNKSHSSNFGKFKYYNIYLNALFKRINKYAVLGKKNMPSIIHDCSDPPFRVCRSRGDSFLNWLQYKTE